MVTFERNLSNVPSSGAFIRRLLVLTPRHYRTEATSAAAELYGQNVTLVYHPRGGARRGGGGGIVFREALQLVLRTDVDHHAYQSMQRLTTVVFQQRWQLLTSVLLRVIMWRRQMNALSRGSCNVSLT